MLADVILTTNEREVIPLLTKEFKKMIDIVAEARASFDKCSHMYRMVPNHTVNKLLMKFIQYSTLQYYLPSTI